MGWNMTFYVHQSYIVLLYVAAFPDIKPMRAAEGGTAEKIDISELMDGRTMFVTL